MTIHFIWGSGNMALKLLLIILQPCLFVQMHARTIACAYINCWHTCVFVHAFAWKVVYVYKCLFCRSAGGNNYLCVHWLVAHMCVRHAFARRVVYVLNCLFVWLHARTIVRAYMTRKAFFVVIVLIIYNTRAGEICKLFKSLPPDHTFLDILKHH